VRTGTQDDTLPIIGPQHSRAYPGFMLAILSMPVACEFRLVALGGPHG
jgi:hypothetical protein